jgi:hypothetical protein
MGPNRGHVPSLGLIAQLCGLCLCNMSTFFFSIFFCMFGILEESHLDSPQGLVLKKHISRVHFLFK